jgi:hypothetical protein
MIYSNGELIPLDAQAEIYNSFNNLGGTSTLGSYDNWLKGQGLNVGTSPLTEYGNTTGLFGMKNSTLTGMGQLAGLAGTAYGLYDSLLGDKSKLYKEQIGMLKDQRRYNDRMIADRAKYKENIGSGLAAAFASPAKTSNVASPAYVK